MDERAAIDAGFAGTLKMPDDSIGSIGWLARMLGDAWAPTPEPIVDTSAPKPTVDLLAVGLPAAGMPGLAPEGLPDRRVRRRRPRRISTRGR